MLSRNYFWLGIVTIIALGLLGRSATADGDLDIVIKGGRIVDGTGAPWYVADVGLADGKIVRIGQIAESDADEVIDADGLIVAPGFIDMMGQTASPMVDDPKTAMNLLTQGITTINAGEGGSAAPLGPEQGRRQGYTTMAEYFALVESKGLPVNLVQTVGHTQIRRIVLGDVDRRPSDDELVQMQSLVQEAMEAGAIGVSTALIYPPAVYATTKEIAALASAAGQYGGRYYTHMRNEGDRLLEAIDEALEIGREGQTPVHIFHLKAAGQQNWGKMQLAIARIKAARSQGHQVTADIYPYINNGLGIAALIHPRHFADGHAQLLARLDDSDLRLEIRNEMESSDGWENWFRHAGKDWDRIVVGRCKDSRYRGHEGKSVAKIAEALDESPWDTFFDLVKNDAFALPQTMTDANKILAMQQEFVSFCTDVGPAGGSRSASHPRAFGAFPRLFSRYVRDLGSISFERAVAQASAAAANNVMAYDRGRIAVGMAADVIVFDYDGLIDRADFKDPAALSEGMKHVLVNGQVVLADGKFTGKRPGRVLRGPGYDAGKAPYAVSSGPTDPRFASYDSGMKEFMRKHRVPGASVAVTDHGKVVFARGYGYADIATHEQVDPESLFRIASLSKPITAVAILQLIENGKLNATDKVFDVLDFNDDIKAAGDAFDVRYREITIEHLLQHRGGWDRDQSFDAMFKSVSFANQIGVPAPADQSAVIRAMLSHKLDFDPGARYAYSNFGYCLLGRVIEKLTGQSYEGYVKQHVLAPIGVTSMRIGATRLDGRAKHEVRYYHPGTTESVFAADLGDTVPSPYGGWNLEAMDSHGAWIASATDLAKFAAAFDDPDNCPILSRRSIEMMYGRPPGLAGHAEDGAPKSRYYSFGWSNRNVGKDKVNHWHTGSLSGTATILIRRHDGKNFVALLNSRVSPSASHLGSEIDNLLHVMANGVTEWPQ
ncbi:N-acyl-D-glutamate deacylase [Rubripirellula lacrimiformis]|uniref:N-acyl-D-glutamate deacylase n=1 Tax=Rubripirellula lacrimiformis TaxID=1930273 RepID=A0A517N4L5_9BACT|nr:serine hydrolase [Rubripirellula lacrimiformis]QDT02074.1 N-acyl-D-glutamate deacylase [Rubripirellula lacrimiformis]